MSLNLECIKMKNSIIEKLRVISRDSSMSVLNSYKQFTWNSIIFIIIFGFFLYWYFTKFKVLIIFY